MKSRHRIFLYLYFSTPNKFILQIIPSSAYSSGLFPLWCNISLYWFLRLISTMYSIYYLSVSFQFNFRYVAFHLLSEVSMFSAPSLVCFFRISPQSYFSVVFIVSHSRVVPTTGYFARLKVFLYKVFSPTMIFPFCPEFHLLSKVSVLFRPEVFIQHISAFQTILFPFFWYYVW